MSKKKNSTISFVERLMRLKAAGLERGNIKGRKQGDLDLLPLEERIEMVFGIFNKVVKNPGKMIYFVMYDIEHDKVRNYIAKYLLKKGCVRVQKSIFLANSERVMFDEIYKALRDVQSVYDNHDSIFLVPVSQEQLQSMKVIGQNLNYDIISGNRNTLFF